MSTSADQSHLVTISCDNISSPCSIDDRNPANSQPENQNSFDTGFFILIELAQTFVDICYVGIVNVICYYFSIYSFYCTQMRIEVPETTNGISIGHFFRCEYRSTVVSASMSTHHNLTHACKSNNLTSLSFYSISEIKKDEIPWSSIVVNPVALPTDLCDLRNDRAFDEWNHSNLVIRSRRATTK
jgi:hypothetical protein